MNYCIQNVIVQRQLCPVNISCRYEREFFFNVVNGRGIVSWAAVAVNQPDGQGDELIGFVTTRTIAAKDSEVTEVSQLNTIEKI